MALTADTRIALHRGLMFLLGGVAGLALWALGESWGSETVSPPLYLALFCWVATYASVALVLAGPVSLPRALVGAILPAVVLTALVSLAGQRFLSATDFLDDPVMLSVAGLLVLYSTPFLLVMLQDPRRWRSYSDLFDAAWTMTMRYVFAWGFVAVFWLVAFLSDALLSLVDVTVIDMVLRSDWARFALSGAILGLGLAVVHELRDTISPYLFLRLLRLLVPVVLAVVLVFLLAVPVRGFAALFGELSAAGTLMGAAIVAITLVSTALDRTDADAVRTRGLHLSTRLLALLLPCLGALSIWAVLLRVAQYGWTPDRILAMTVAAFLFIYGLGYCLSAIRRAGWMARIRAVNVAMAITVIGAGMLWMTPVLDVHRLSTASQIARFERGESTLDQLALWQMAHGWGRAGKAGLAQLESLTERADYADLLERIDTVRSEPNPFQYEQSILRQTAPDRALALYERMPVRPDGATLELERLIEVPSYRAEGWLEGCKRPLPDGQPGCVLVRGAFMPLVETSDQAVILYLDADGRGRADHVHWGADQVRVNAMFDMGSGTWPELGPDAIAAAQDGAFDIRPSGERALFLGDVVLTPVP